MSIPVLANDAILLIGFAQDEAHDHCATLRAAGYHVETKRHDADLTAAMLQSRLSALVVDAGDHAASCFELLDTVRRDERLRHIAVIVLSTADDDAAMLATIDRGATDLLHKPTRPFHLLARIRAGCDRSRLIMRERDHRHLVELELRRAERLMYDVLPPQIATRLKAGEQVIADGYESVSVLFADLVGFTRYADGRSPADVVRCLDTIFSRFDELVAAHRAEKIKTIGDGYLAVCGLPSPCVEHAIVLADLALAMREAVRTFTSTTGERFQLRVGIASGPVVAGIIGTQRHVYDLWGDTVNIASRMESAAPHDGILLSETTADLVRGTFRLDEPQTLEIKGKGRMLGTLLHSRNRPSRRMKHPSSRTNLALDAQAALDASLEANSQWELIDAETNLLTGRGFLPLADNLWRAGAREDRGLLVLRLVVSSPVTAHTLEFVVRLLRDTSADSDLLLRWSPNVFGMLRLERTLTNPEALCLHLDSKLRRAKRVPSEFSATFQACRIVPEPTAVGRASEGERQLLQFVDGDIGGLPTWSFVGSQER